MPTAVEPDASWHLQLLPAPSAGQPTVLPALRVARRGDANALRPLPATAAAPQRLVFVGDYVAPLSQLVKRFKFHHAPELAPALARLMLLRWQLARREQYLNRPDLILAVPLHASRCWRRGYNQSDLLARPLARWLGCPYRPAALRRVRKTAQQQRLNAGARRRNLQRAFICTVSVAGRHIAPVDDVVTTGSTVAEIAALLRRQGAASVQIWCVCRTL